MLKRRPLLRRAGRGTFALFVLGLSLGGLALLMLSFALYAAFINEPWVGFLIAALASAGVGSGLTFLGSPKAAPTRREALSSLLLLWLILPAFGALPYYVDGGLSPLNAYFEAMSGFTTTGATVLVDFTDFNQSLFLWRALTQWLGGVGIIVLFIAVLPQLAIAGRQLFFAEAPGPTEEKLTPRLRNTASAVLRVYAGLTLACALLYFAFGMDAYNALAHAFTTLAAGGFSPNPLSFEGFNPSLSWVAVVFMLFAGANFALLYRAAALQPKRLFQDAEFRAYTAVALLGALAITVPLIAQYGPLDALRHGFFQSLSILTTAGYASADFAFWPREAQLPIILLMFVGGSAGSAGGGVKVVRWLMLLQSLRRTRKQTLHPRAVYLVRVGQRVVPEDVLRAVSAFVTLYLLLFTFTTSVLVLLGADYLSAFTAAIACIGNVGPGLATVGPMANFAELHPLSRALLIFGMYAGRLEVVTIFAVFDSHWWRPPQGLFRPKADR